MFNSYMKYQHQQCLLCLFHLNSNQNMQTFIFCLVNFIISLARNRKKRNFKTLTFIDMKHKKAHYASQMLYIGKYLQTLLFLILFPFVSALNILYRVKYTQNNLTILSYCFSMYTILSSLKLTVHFVLSLQQIEFVANMHAMQVPKLYLI